jgi:hypothetical protein
MSGELHAPAALLPEKEPPPPSHWMGGRVIPRAGLGDVERRKILSLPGSNSDLLAVQPVASRYTDCSIKIHNFIISDGEEARQPDRSRQRKHFICWMFLPNFKPLERFVSSCRILLMKMFRRSQEFINKPTLLQNLSFNDIVTSSSTVCCERIHHEYENQEWN